MGFSNTFHCNLITFGILHGADLGQRDGTLTRQCLDINNLNLRYKFVAEKSTGQKLYSAILCNAVIIVTIFRQQTFITPFLTFRSCAFNYQYYRHTRNGGQRPQ